MESESWLHLPVELIQKERISWTWERQCDTMERTELNLSSSIYHLWLLANSFSLLDLHFHVHKMGKLRRHTFLKCCKDWKYTHAVLIHTYLGTIRDRDMCVCMCVGGVYPIKNIFFFLRFLRYLFLAVSMRFLSLASYKWEQGGVYNVWTCIMAWSLCTAYRIVDGNMRPSPTTNTRCPQWGLVKSLGASLSWCSHFLCGSSSMSLMVLCNPWPCLCIPLATLYTSAEIPSNSMRAFKDTNSQALLQSLQVQSPVRNV